MRKNYKSKKRFVRDGSVQHFKVGGARSKSRGRKGIIKRKSYRFRGGSIPIEYPATPLFPNATKTTLAGFDTSKIQGIEGVTKVLSNQIPNISSDGNNSFGFGDNSSVQGGGYLNKKYNPQKKKLRKSKKRNYRIKLQKGGDDIAEAEKVFKAFAEQIVKINKSTVANLAPDQIRQINEAIDQFNEMTKDLVPQPAGGQVAQETVAEEAVAEEAVAEGEAEEAVAEA